MHTRLKSFFIIVRRIIAEKISGFAQSRYMYPGTKLQIHVRRP